MMELFDSTPPASPPSSLPPLAERVRPRTLAGFVGQDHLLGPGKPLGVLIGQDRVPSMILWGPPGSGKTTLARIIAAQTRAQFFQLSAVAAGVRELRAVIDRAAASRQRSAGRTILFIDEIHRFNKAQQDALLHSVEDGVITLVGATTENPSFEVIAPLLSRARVYVLEPLTDGHLRRILEHAMATDPALAGCSCSGEEGDLLIRMSGGDARTMLNGLETAVALARAAGGTAVGKREIEEALQRTAGRYDKGGEEHYAQISAFIKSVRGSDPDATVYWLARMLEGGEDPLFIARRMIILASEDIGNADPYALTLATSCFTAVHAIGMPEARIPLAQTAVYLAACEKSNAAYVAVSEALADVRARPGDAVPLHLRNAPTSLMKNLGYGAAYRYAHDHADGFVEQQYLPDALKDRVYYRPADRGGERRIRERLAAWWKSKRRS